MNDANRYEALFNHASMGIVVVNANGLIESANPFALQLFGYLQDELNGQPIENLIPKRFHHKHVPQRDSYIKNPNNRPMGLGLDLFGIRKDGSEFPVEISLGSYETNGEKNVIAFIIDISVRKKIEALIVELNDKLEETVEQRTKDLQKTLQELEQTNSKLDAIQSFQKALIDNAGAMIIATDEKGLIKLFNPEASINIGYQELEIVNKTTPVIFHDKKEIENKRLKLFSEYGINLTNKFDVLVEKSKRHNHEEEQYTYVRKDGSTFPVSLTITSIRNYNGVITGYMGIAIDISERIKAEKDLRKALEKEKELGELKSRFVSMASHEFRTPLSTVLSSAFLIEKYTLEEDQIKRKKHLQRIVSSVNMLTDILNDFLSVGKIEEGRIQVRPTQFNLQQFITNINDEIVHNLKTHQQIRYSHEGDSEVIIDASLLKHIVMNLISNASKFSPESGFIDIKTKQENDHIMLSIKDYGIGISKDDQKHLMERFFRGTNAGNIEGTGLGLHIVAKYAELMNGTVKYTSELEKGTEFVITFNTKID